MHEPELALEKVEPAHLVLPQVKLWKAKEVSFIFVAWLYQTFAAFYVLCFVTLLEGPRFREYLTAVSLGLGFALGMRPGMSNSLNTSPLLARVP